MLVEGVEVQSQHLKCMDVEKEITNITINDVSVELADITICTYMSQFGDVVHGSIKRGVVKGTNIETGTRYIQIVNCAPTIPNLTNFGSFNVRLFADNNRTACRHCNRTDLPSYKCDKKTRSQTKTTRSCRPAIENQKIKCNEPMGYTPLSYIIGKRNDGTLGIMMS